MISYAGPCIVYMYVHFQGFVLDFYINIGLACTTYTVLSQN